MLEKGNYTHPAKLSFNELESLENMFERCGALASEDLGISTLAGSTWGGGTAINW